MGVCASSKSIAVTEDEDSRAEKIMNDDGAEVIAMNTERRESQASRRSKRYSKKDFPTRLHGSDSDSDLDANVRGSVSSTAEDSSKNRSGNKSSKRKKPSQSNSQLEVDLDAVRAAAEAAADAEDLDDAANKKRIRLGDISPGADDSDEEDEGARAPPRGLQRPKSLAERVDDLEPTSSRRPKIGVSAIRTPRSVNSHRKNASKSVNEVERRRMEADEAEERERLEMEAELKRQADEHEEKKRTKKKKKRSIVRKPSDRMSPRAAYIMEAESDEEPPAVFASDKSIPTVLKRRSIKQLRKDSIKRRLSMKDDEELRDGHSPTNYAELFTQSMRRRSRGSSAGSRGSGGSLRAPRVSVGDASPPSLVSRLRASSGSPESERRSPAARMHARAKSNAEASSRRSPGSPGSRRDTGNNNLASPVTRARSNSAGSPRSPRSPISAIRTPKAGARPKRSLTNDDEANGYDSTPKVKPKAISPRGRGLKRPKSVDAMLSDEDDEANGIVAKKSTSPRSPRSKAKSKGASSIRRPKSLKRPKSIDAMLSDEDDGPR